MAEDLAALKHYRTKLSITLSLYSLLENIEAERRERHRDLEKLRSHNDYYQFLSRLLKEEDKVAFMLALEKDTLITDTFKEKL